MCTSFYRSLWFFMFLKWNLPQFFFFTQVDLHPFALKASSFLWKSLLALFFSIKSPLSSSTSSSLSSSSLLTSLSSYLSSLHVSLSLTVSTAPPWPSSTASHTLFWSWFGLINLMLPRHRPIYSNSNPLAVFPLPRLRKGLRIDSWFHLATNLATNIVNILHTLHITVYMMRPVTHFPLSPRSDDENYDVRAILHGIL